MKTKKPVPTRQLSVQQRKQLVRREAYLRETGRSMAEAERAYWSRITSRR